MANETTAGGTGGAVGNRSGPGGDPVGDDPRSRVRAALGVGSGSIPAAPPRTDTRDEGETGPGRWIWLGVLGVAAIAALASWYLPAREPRMVPLFEDEGEPTLSTRDRERALIVLAGDGVSAVKGARGGILVPEDKLARAYKSLESEGIGPPSLERAQRQAREAGSLWLSPAERERRERAALEDELAAMILRGAGVAGAWVRVVPIQERGLGGRRGQSIVATIETAAGARLDKETADGVGEMLKARVPDLIKYTLFDPSLKIRFAWDAATDSATEAGGRTRLAGTLDEGNSRGGPGSGRVAPPSEPPLRLPDDADAPLIRREILARLRLAGFEDLEVQVQPRPVAPPARPRISETGARMELNRPLDASAESEAASPAGATSTPTPTPPLRWDVVVRGSDYARLEAGRDGIVRAVGEALPTDRLAGFRIVATGGRNPSPGRSAPTAEGAGTSRVADARPDGAAATPGPGSIPIRERDGGIGRAGGGDPNSEPPDLPTSEREPEAEAESIPPTTSVPNGSGSDSGAEVADHDAHPAGFDPRPWIGGVCVATGLGLAAWSAYLAFGRGANRTVASEAGTPGMAGEGAGAIPTAVSTSIAARAGTGTEGGEPGAEARTPRVPESSESAARAIQRERAEAGEWIRREPDLAASILRRWILEGGRTA